MMTIHSARQVHWRAAGKNSNSHVSSWRWTDAPFWLFFASDLNQATGLCSEDWFITELASYRSHGFAVWDGTAEFTVRIANPAEAAKVQMALVNELVRGEYEGHIFAFLLPVDASCQ
jgi:hypothetical protein